VRLYRVLQLPIFICCPVTLKPNNLVDAGIRHILPSATTLTSRSTRNQRGNCIPIIAAVQLHCILQLAVFVFYPFTRPPTRPVDAWIQDFMPSATTLVFRSTRNQCCNCTPILAAMRLCSLLQLDVLVFCPSARTFICPVDAVL
jgi:hypothetical protein